MEENQTLDFNKLPLCSDDEISYIESRGIKYDKVKDIVRGGNKSVRCKIAGFNKKGDFDIINIQSRFIEKKGNERFKTIEGHKATGVYIERIDKNCDILFLVEGMFDFLSLYQFTNNVIGIFNASSTETIDVLKHIIEKKQPKRIVLIADIDVAGDGLKYRLQQHIENLGTVDLSELGKFKDINDLICNPDFGYDDFVGYANKEYERMLTDRVKEIEKEKLEQFEKVKNINKVHQSGKPIEFPVDTLNKEIGKIKPDDFSILIGSPNSGKTTFAYIMMLHNIDIGHTVGFLSYEMDFGDILNQYYLWKIPGAMDRFDESSLTDDDDKKLAKYKEEIYKNKRFYTYGGDRITIDRMKEDINKLILAGCDYIVIDNLIKIRWTQSEIADNQEVIEELFNIKKQKGIGIMLLHHTDKLSSVKNLLSYKGTSDVQIKPDNLFYIRRPSLTPGDEGMTIDEKCELVVRRAKQRMGRSHAGNEGSIYFWEGMYYNQKDFFNIINSL